MILCFSIKKQQQRLGRKYECMHTSFKAKKNYNERN